jgi:hypothetical protein
MNARYFLRSIILFSFISLSWWPVNQSYAQEGDSTRVSSGSPRILFIGNSYTMGDGSPVRYFRPHSVDDLNGKGVGGVPALFKLFAAEAGSDFTVSLEASPGKNLDYHLNERSDVIGRAWDYVVLQGHSLLDTRHPGDPGALRRSARSLAELLLSKNPSVHLQFVSTWSRADQTYPDSGYWHGKPIEQMALDVRKGYDLAAADCAPAISHVVPVGEAWNLAMKEGVADPNPYDGISPGQINLWTYDHYHASAYGYYLSALMIFADITGLDPRSLGRSERAAYELGFSQSQAAALQQVAFEELTTTNGASSLKPFIPKTAAEE